MKKMFLAMLLVFVSTGLFAANENKETKEYVKVVNMAEWNTCKASLKYTKATVVCPKMYREVSATVLVNCKQENDVYITVAAYKDGEHVGSDIVTVEAGKLSGTNKIYVRGCETGDEVTLKIE